MAMLVTSDNLTTRYEFVDEIGFVVLKIVFYPYMRKCDFYSYTGGIDLSYIGTIGF